MNFIDKLDSTIADLPNYRKRQIYRAIFKNAYDAWEKATDLSLDMRALLNKQLPLSISSKLFLSRDERTAKALILLQEGRYTETVLMKSKDRNSICVSTQVGCPIGCPFCASGKHGFVRNLTQGEIVAQILLFSRLLKKSDQKVTNIVFMGIGEPFFNYDNVIGAIRFLNRPNTLNLAARRFSISTAGYLPGIDRLSKEDSLNVNLAVSLHSALKKKRDMLVPINQKYPLEDLSRSLRTYFQRTGRKIMFEYALVQNVNMAAEDAFALRNYINTIDAAYVVNLVPINQTGSDFQAPTAPDIKRFKEHLEENKLNFIQRFTFGRDIQAACGQLAGEENRK